MNPEQAAPERADPEQAHFEAALHRITWGMAGLAAAGCLAGMILRGWRWGIAYALGASASILNFYWLKRVVDALAGTSKARVSPKFAILIGLRYLLLGAGAYAIVNFTSLSLPAALIGLFVPVAAVILEIIFELMYAAS
ncbi:MAG TPA: ATP synthase subunit I [Bryobacteraceae bacterium]|nr:ATP synthase subunit I [Bryobacteraceae bacterium]